MDNYERPFVIRFQSMVLVCAAVVALSAPVLGSQYNIPVSDLSSKRPFVVNGSLAGTGLSVSLDMTTYEMIKQGPVAHTLAFPIDLRTNLVLELERFSSGPWKLRVVGFHGTLRWRHLRSLV